MAVDFELRRQVRMAMRGVPERLGLAFADGQVEMRAKPSGHGTTNYEWNGYAAVYGYEFPMWDPHGEPYTENVAYGASKRSLNNPSLDVPFLIGHNDAGIPLARTKSGTMRLSEDSHGTHSHVPSMDGRREEVRALYSAVERGDMDEMSLAFVCTRQEWDAAFERRTIIEWDLHRGDVCAVVHGANQGTAGASMFPVEQLSLRRPVAIGAPALLERRLPTQPYSRGAGEDAECPQCHSFNDADARFCDQCGTGLRPSAPYCPQPGETQRCRCGAWQAPDAKICDQCGQGLVNDHDADDGYGCAVAAYSAGGRMETRSLTSSEKSEFESDIKKSPTHELGAMVHRFVQWGGSGNYPTGMSHADCEWAYNALCAELKRRDPHSKAGGNFPSEHKSAARPLEYRCPAEDHLLGRVKARWARTHKSQSGDAQPLEQLASAADTSDTSAQPDYDAAAAGHAPFTGSHSHAHSDYAGGVHRHGHSHDGDAGHGHGHSASIMVDASTGIPGPETQMSAARKMELMWRELELEAVARRR